MKRKYFKRFAFLATVLIIMLTLVPNLSKAMNDKAPLDINKPQDSLEINKPEEFGGLEINSPTDNSSLEINKPQEDNSLEVNAPTEEEPSEESEKKEFIDDITPSTNNPQLLIDGKSIEEFFEPYVEILGEDISYGNLVTGHYILDNKVSDIELEELEAQGVTTFKANLLSEIQGRANGYAPDVKEDWPKITLDGDIAYCLNIKRKVPQNIPYGPTTTVPDLNKGKSLEQINVMLMHGYPSDASGMKAAYGISDKTARENTQKAVWQMSDDGGLLSPINTPYTDAIMGKGTNLVYPWKEFSVSSSTLNFTDRGSYWESQNITTSGGPGTFNIPNNGDVYAVNSGGATTTSFKMGDSFKIRVSKTHNGAVNISVTGNYVAKKVTWWKPLTGPDSESGYQYLARTENDPVTRVKPLAGTVQGKGSILVSKTDAESGAKLQGAVIGLFRKDGSEVTRGTTDGAGNVTFSNINVGNYDAREISAPSGYVLNSQNHNVKVNAAQTSTVTIGNTSIKGNVKIIKSDSESGAKLQGAKFELRRQDGSVVSTSTTDGNGEITFSNIPYGTYTYVETQAPTGYVLGNITGTVTIKNHNETITVNAKNTKAKGNIEVTKKDAENSEVLAGAVFGLYQSGNEIQRKSTNSSGKVLFENVNYGDYEVKEITPPTGFLLNTTVLPVQVRDNGKTYYVEMTNIPIKGNVEILKKDAENGNVLQGAVFGLYQNGTLIQQGTSNAQGIVRFENLRYGNYEVKEITPPTGFLLNQGVLYVEVRENGKTYKLEVANEPIKGNIEIIKKDAEAATISERGSIVDDIEFDIPNNGLLEGVKFGLFQGNTKISEATTDADGKATFKNIRYGDYVVRELEPLINYLPNTKDFPVQVREHNKIYTISVTNQPIKGHVQIKKIDSETKEPLAGAVFGIYSKDDKKLAEATTGDDGIVRFENLRYGEYKIKEIAPPIGFLLNDKVLTVQVVEHGKTYELEMENEPIKAPVEIIKVDAKTKMFIKDVVFGLYKDGQLLEELKTNDRGYAKSKDYRYGDYTLKEISAPPEYEIKQDITDVQIREHAKVLSFTFENEKKVSDLIISKINARTREPIKGVQYRVKDAYNFDKTITTDEQGIATVVIPYGDYTLTEVSAPANFIKDTQPYTIMARGEKQLDFNHTNEEKEGYVKIVKRDDITKEKLKGVSFDIYDINDIFVETITTDDNGEAVSGPLIYGSYYAKEKAPLPGYLPNERIYKFDITSDEQIFTINVYNSPKLGNVEVIKTDAENGNAIEGVKFEIYDSTGKKIDTMTTDVNGRAYSRGLRLGKYTMKEVGTPPQFVLNQTVWDIEITDHKQIVTFDVKNIPVKGKIAIKKVDYDNNDLPVVGAEFTIYSDKECLKPLETIVTNEDGYAESKEYRYGRYFIKETSVTDNYWMSTEIREVFISKHEQVYTFNVTNEIRKSKISILKRDEKTGELLKGIEFKVSCITDEEFEPVVITTNETGIAETDLLEYGTYLIEEITAPRKYLLAKPIEVVVDGNQASVSKPLEPDVIEVPIFNTPKETGLYIEKVYKTTDMDMESGKIKTPYLNLPYSKSPISEYPLTNVTFEIFKLQGDKLYTDLMDGVQNPDEDEEIIEDEEPVEGEDQEPVEGEDEPPVEGEEVIEDGETPVDPEGETPVDGDDLEGIEPDPDVEEEVVWESLGVYTTDVNGLIRLNNLPWGSYKIVETIPTGLEGSKEIIVNLTGNGEIENLKIYNTSKKGLLEIYKTDINGHPIEGVVFDILDEEGDLIKTCTTDKNGKFDIELEVGNYFYKEVSVPEVPNGYYVFDDSPVSFTISDEALVFSANVVNEFARLPKTSKTARDYDYLIIIGVIGIVVVLGTALIIRRKRK